MKLIHDNRRQMRQITCHAAEANIPDIQRGPETDIVRKKMNLNFVGCKPSGIACHKVIVYTRFIVIGFYREKHSFSNSATSNILTRVGTERNYCEF